MDAQMPLPTVVTRVTGRPYPRSGHVHDVPGGDQVADMPAADAGSIVRVEVGRGLRPRDLPGLLTLAARTRTAATVEVIGRSERAVKDARKALLRAWDSPVAVPVQSSGRGAWVDLLMAQVTKP